MQSLIFILYVVAKTFCICALFLSIQSVKPQQPETASLPAGQPSPTHGPVRDITTHVLISLLR